MPDIHSKIIRSIVNGWAWGLDYVYVAYWQTHEAIFRTDPAIYMNDGSRDQNPILLIPGVYENWRFMKPIADYLFDRGYPIHVIDGLGYNVGEVEAMAKIVKAYIDDNGLTDCIIVAHSKGGLVGKYVLAHFNLHQQVKGMIALNTPFVGSSYAYLIPTKTIRMFLPNSSIIKLLTADTSVNQSIVSIYGQFDPHIPKGSYLQGANNIQLNTRGHFRIMKNAAVHQAILDSIVRFQ